MYTVTPDIFTRRMNILIYGDPGAGKTHLAGTAQDHPGMANVHFFNVDGGMMTLARRGDISATDIRSVEELEAEMWKIAQGHEDYKGINTIVIDNITELQTLSLEGIVANEIRKGPRKEAKKTIDDIQIEDYGKSTKQMARVLRGFRDLPINKIYVAHRKDRTRRNSTVVESTGPSLTEKLAVAVSGYMDFVWYLYAGTEEETGPDGPVPVLHRYLLTQPYDIYFAKTRGTLFAERLGPMVRDPNMADIFQLYLEVAGLEDNN